MRLGIMYLACWVYVSYKKQLARLLELYLCVAYTLLFILLPLPSPSRLETTVMCFVLYILLLIPMPMRAKISGKNTRAFLVVGGTWGVSMTSRYPFLLLLLVSDPLIARAVVDAALVTYEEWMIMMVMSTHRPPG